MACDCGAGVAHQVEPARTAGLSRADRDLY